MIVAIFDCDGTLFTAQFGRGLLTYATENGAKDNAKAYYTALLLPHILRKLRLISRKTYHRPLIANMGKILKGWDEEQAQKCFEWVVNEYLLPTEHPEVVRRLKEHREKDHHVVLVSGIMTPALRLLKDHYQAAEIIGTNPEFIDGLYTGQISPPIIMGDEKATQVSKLLNSGNDTVDWSNSYSYADTIMDKTVLELTGHPVAVYPDRKLYNAAKNSGWEVIGSIKDA